MRLGPGGHWRGRRGGRRGRVGEGTTRRRTGPGRAGGRRVGVPELGVGRLGEECPTTPRGDVSPPRTIPRTGPAERPAAAGDGRLSPCRCEQWSGGRAEDLGGPGETVERREDLYADVLSLARLQPGPGSARCPIDSLSAPERLRTEGKDTLPTPLLVCESSLLPGKHWRFLGHSHSIPTIVAIPVRKRKTPPLLVGRGTGSGCHLPFVFSGGL